jgi:hypothetical protein
MSWFVEGQSANRDEFIKNAYHGKVNKFWMNKGESREVLFTSDERFGIYEHVLQVAEKKFEYHTCSEDDCSFCARKSPRYYQEYCSILDLTPYTSKKDGKEYKFTKRALGIGKETAAILELRRRECGGTLVGRKFKASRIGEKSKSCGNDWVHLAMDKPIDLSKLPPEARPYDFRDALRPLPKNQAEALLNYFGNGQKSIVSSGVSSRDSLSAFVASGPSNSVSGLTGPSDANTFDMETDIPF